MKLHPKEISNTSGRFYGSALSNNYKYARHLDEWEVGPTFDSKVPKKLG